MFTKIFPIVNIESAFCHWKTDPSGNIKACHIGGMKKPLGICSAMLMVWLKKVWLQTVRSSQLLIWVHSI